MREESGMNKNNQLVLLAVKILCIIVSSLLILDGWALKVSAQTLTTLYSFGGPDGTTPIASLVQADDGNFYGTTYAGGGTGNGTVFRISPAGSLTNLYSFTGGSDGYRPYGLVRGTDGNFYGTTERGGTSNNGTVFRISPSGSLTNLYSFTGGGDGGIPYAGLVRGSDGFFYGTTHAGGTSTNCNFGCGTVFRISPSGSVTNLHSFGGADGANPYAALVQGNDGHFYGTTQFGGTNGTTGFGTVFRISPSGNFTSLHSFTGGSDGALPLGSLVQGVDGNFYGTTREGGTSGTGTVFRISPNGTLTNLYSFSGGNDGAFPYAGLVQGSDGYFYGSTPFGGTSTNCPEGCGIVFRISPDGSLTNLHSFGGGDGAVLDAGLVQGSDGYFYGASGAGGASTNCYGGGCGTVFRLTIPLTPRPNQISQVCRANSNIVIAIPSVSGETYQLQCSSSMTPTNWVNVPGVSVTNSIGGLLTLTNFGGALQPQGFYRFDITP